MGVTKVGDVPSKQDPISLLYGNIPLITCLTCIYLFFLLIGIKQHVFRLCNSTLQVCVSEVWYPCTHLAFNMNLALFQYVYTMDRRVPLHIQGPLLILVVHTLLSTRSACSFPATLDQFHMFQNQMNFPFYLYIQ